LAKPETKNLVLSHQEASTLMWTDGQS